MVKIKSRLRKSFSSSVNYVIDHFSDVKASELLMIDGLIENTSPAVRDLWQQDGGDGQYPPPSINVSIVFCFFFPLKMPQTFYQFSNCNLRISVFLWVPSLES